MNSFKIISIDTSNHYYDDDTYTYYKIYNNMQNNVVYDCICNDNMHRMIRQKYVSNDLYKMITSYQKINKDIYLDVQISNQKDYKKMMSLINSNMSFYVGNKEGVLIFNVNDDFLDCIYVYVNEELYSIDLGNHYYNEYEALWSQHYRCDDDFKKSLVYVPSLKHLKNFYK